MSQPLSSCAFCGIHLTNIIKHAKPCVLFCYFISFFTNFVPILKKSSCKVLYSVILHLPLCVSLAVGVELVLSYTSHSVRSPAVGVELVLSYTSHSVRSPAVGVELVLSYTSHSVRSPAVGVELECYLTPPTL